MKTVKQAIGNTFATAIFAFMSSSSFAHDVINPSNVITPHPGFLTMVNVLTPAAGQQAETIRLLQAGMNETMRYQPGFISANIHQSLNSEHVVVYAQWQDKASVDAAVKLIQSGQAPNMAKAFTIAHADFHPYEVMSVHLASATQAK